MAYSATTYKGRSGKVYTGTIGSDSQIMEIRDWQYEAVMGEIDVTVLGDTSRQWETDLLDGTVAINGFFLPGDTGQAALIADLAAGTGVTVTVYLEGTAAATHDHLTGSVVINRFSTGGSVEGKVSVSFSGRGQLTPTAGSA